MKKKRLISGLILFLIISAGLGNLAWRHLYHGAGHEAAYKKHKTRYQCPMHPSYTSDKPGDCPICNMALVPMEEEQAPTTSLKNICILHNCKMLNCPMELPLKPGEKVSCPICGVHVAEAAETGGNGKILYWRHPMRPEVTSPVPKKDEMGMDYVPVYAEETASQTPVPGQATVTVTQERQQLIGMKSEPVQKRNLTFTIKASGRVAYDTDLYNTVAEYQEAVKARDKVKDSPWPDVHERAGALVHSSALRLRQLGLSESQIKQITGTSQKPTNLLLGGPDSAVWVYAQIYEYEIGSVKAGQAAEITTPAYPGQKFRGTVKAIDPILSADTRTLKVRIEVPDKEGLLKLEMFVNAAIIVDLGKTLALPEEALLDTGERKLVFIDLGSGRIEPREVTLGHEADNYYEIISGVNEGEKVVTSANFLIDSESKLKAAISKTKEHTH